MLKSLFRKNLIIWVLVLITCLFFVEGAYCLYSKNPATKTIILTPSANVTYTFNEHPAWVLNDRCVVIVYCFNSGSDICWVDTTYDPVTDSFTATIDTSIYTGCNLVRFAEGTTAATANWSNKYNQTSDLSLQGGTTVSTSGKWS